MTQFDIVSQRGKKGLKSSRAIKIKAHARGDNGGKEPHYSDTGREKEKIANIISS